MMLKDYYGVDDIDMILEQALKVAKEVVAPTRDDNDAVQAQFKEGQVTVPPSFGSLIGLFRRTDGVPVMRITIVKDGCPRPCLGLVESIWPELMRPLLCLGYSRSCWAGG